MIINFIERINEATTLNLSIVKQLQTRKGYAYRVTQSGIDMLLKIIELKTDDGLTRTRSLQKEATILRELKNFTNDLYVTSGELDDHFWLLRKWIRGKTAPSQLAYIQEKPLSTENKIRFLCDSSAMLEKVIDLYQAGYLHGDLQPSHFIFDEDSIHLIDLELAIKINDPNFYYRGALVHFVPPETADGMLQNTTKIPLDPVSEIYSFAAVIYFLYTQVVPVAYGDTMEDTSFDFPFEDQLIAVKDGRVRSFKQAGADPFPELEQILLKCLQKNRLNRFQSFDELLNAFQKYIKQ